MPGEIFRSTLESDALTEVRVDKEGAGHAVGSSQARGGQPDLLRGTRRVSFINPEAMKSFQRIAEEREVPVENVIAKWNQTIL